MYHSPIEKGLSATEVQEQRKQYGRNVIEAEQNRVLLQVLKETVLEPMFILLVATCAIYFTLGQYQEGVIMLVAISIVTGISLFQEYRSRNAIASLKKLSAAKATVVRDGEEQQIATEELVVGDVLLLEEGELVPADGLLTAANDFSLNESVLTGESFSVYKNEKEQHNVYKGTLVTSGSATVTVNAVGAKTMLGKIGASLQEITIVKTPLQQQIKSFVRSMVWVGAIAFLIVVGVNYYHSGNLIQSLLRGLTLAMSILPEEIPVAFSTFQALGAFRLLRRNIIVKQPQYVETLGSATVICADKTGTLTQNKMSIEWLYDAATEQSVSVHTKQPLPEALIEFAMWSSETQPFDPMEQAIHQLYTKTAKTDKRNLFRQIHEYPVGGKPPMMTHIFSGNAGETIIAAKGAPEAIIRQSHLSDKEIKKIETQLSLYTQQGYRVLSVGRGSWKEEQWPATQQEFPFAFLGLIVFHDPPKEHIAETIASFNKAGITVKMITGDYADTALAIAQQVQLPHNNEVLTGNEVLHLTPKQLQEKVSTVNIFARMFPEAKLKVIDALKENGEVVAMTGDGVNDSPALKAAHIGIAMGKRGSEVAKSAASLILTDDDLAHMTDAVALGRKIYDNLKKAIQYIISIHIPIILIVTIPLLLGWAFTEIFTPVHVIFLELIMGPTCSIIYENEPMEPGTMLRPPRKMSNTFLTFKQLSTSMVQGLAITTACLGTGYYYLYNGGSDTLVRTVIFITLLLSNVLLTLVNRSFRYSLFTTITYKNNLVPLITGITLILTAAMLYVPFLKQLFGLTGLPVNILLVCTGAAMAGTLWMELWKWARR